MFDFKKIAVTILLIFQFLFIYSQSKNHLKVGKPAIDFILQNQNGVPISLSSFKGKFVLLDFWASWCRPCRENNKELIDIYNLFHSKGFEIVAVSLDKNKESWLKAIEKDQLPWYTHLCDFKDFDSEPALKYNINQIPTSFLIDTNGVLISIDPDLTKLERKLEKILKHQVTFYPHYTKDSLTFSDTLNYQIYDDKNTILIQGRGKSVNVQNLENNTYHIKYASREHKFVKY